MSNAPRAPKRPDAGFSLVELLVTMSITSTIVLSLASAVTVGLRVMDGTHQRLSESHDAQMMSTFLIPDVQSGFDVSLDANTCGDLVQGVKVADIVSFSWTDGSAAKVASYVVNNVPGEKRLTRVYCVDRVVSNQSAIVHNLGVSNPVLKCIPACTPTATRPHQVSVTVTDTGGYSFTLTGARRAATS